MLAFKFASLLRCLLLITFLLQPLGSKKVWAETVFSENGVIASRSSLASAVGAEIMEQGGNAIDAAVASGFALAVTYPSAGNLGGGGFMVIRLADGQMVTNDHREKAPILATKDMYLDDDEEIGMDVDTVNQNRAESLEGKLKFVSSQTSETTKTTKDKNENQNYKQ